MKLRRAILAVSLVGSVFGGGCGEGSISGSGEPASPRGSFSESDGGVDPFQEPQEQPPKQPQQEAPNENGAPPLFSGGECSPLSMAVLPDCDGSAYYVDAAQGSDSNPGSVSAPWKTLQEARQSAPSGSTICVNTGDYGKFTESSPRGISERHVIRAAPGQSPRLSGISIKYGSRSPAQLTMSGFSVRGTSGDIVNVENVEGLRLSQLNISAQKWAVGGTGVDGMRIWDSKDVTVDSTKFESLHRGIQVQDSDGIRILGNYIQATAGSGIQYLYRNTNGEIAYNHIHGVDYSSSDPDAVQSPHASIISFRSGDVALRGNHLHGMGNSSGIMFYNEASVSEYSNVLIENNAIYDVINEYSLRVYKLGSNFVVRNNVIFGGLRSGECNGGPKDARYRYKTAIIAHDGALGSGMRLYNNVFAGIVSVGSSAIEDERNNYAWSWKDWVSTSPSGTSEIVTFTDESCGGHDPIFEDGSFFAKRIDPTFPGRSVHDLSLAPGSPGWNFGDPAVQALESIGTVEPSGFILPGGPCRSSNQHSVGAHELE